MSQHSIRALLEQGLFPTVSDDSPYAADKAQAIERLLSTMLASAECLGQVANAVSAAAERTAGPALDASLHAADLADQGKRFAAMARDIKNLANHTTMATGEILEQCDAALSFARHAADALETVVGPAAIAFNEVAERQAESSPPTKVAVPELPANVVHFPKRS